MVASYNLLAIPVVDEENKLVGVITVDDVIDVIKDEATEDVYRLAGVAGDDRVFTPAVRVAAQARCRGCVVNLVTAFLAASVVALFESTIGAVHGARGLHAGRRRHGRQRRDADADGHRPRHRARRADLEQHAQGAVQGGARSASATASPAASSARSSSGSSKAIRGSAAILAMAMIINMFVAATAGTLIPLALRALKVDPALASSVFITTLTDVFGFLSFLGLATLFIRYLQQPG